jgi:hypothetical protein
MPSPEEQPRGTLSSLKATQTAHRAANKMYSAPTASLEKILEDKQRRYPTVFGRPARREDDTDYDLFGSLRFAGVLLLFVMFLMFLLLLVIP